MTIPTKVFFVCLATLTAGITLPYTPLIRSSETIQTIAVALRLPALRVNDAVLNFRDVIGLAKTLDKTGLGLETGDIRKRLLQKMQEDTLMKTIANDLGATWTQDDVDVYYTLFMRSNFRSDINSIAQLTDIDEDIFKERIIVPFLLRDIVGKYLIINSTNNARTRAEEIHAQVARDPIAFEAVRASISQDVPDSPESQIILTDEEISNDNLAMLRTMDTGDITPIIAMYDGYRIYKVVNYFDEPQRAWQLSEIYIPSDVLNETIREYAAKARIRVYAKSYFYN